MKTEIKLVSNFITVLKSKKFFIAVVVLSSFCTACNNTNTANDSVDSAMNKNKSNDSKKYGTTYQDTTGGDETFLVKAYAGGMEEVMLGTIAQKNAASANVKQFGEMMIKDHTNADSEMVEIARAKKIVLPVSPSKDQYSDINKLQEKQGDDFDKNYVSMMTDDHKNDIDDFKKEMAGAKDPDVKSFAVKTIPVLQKHLDAIQTIQNNMKK